MTPFYQTVATIASIPLLLIAVYVLFRVASAAWYRSKFEWGQKYQEPHNGKK